MSTEVRGRPFRTLAMILMVDIEISSDDEAGVDVGNPELVEGSVEGRKEGGKEVKEERAVVPGKFGW